MNDVDELVTTTRAYAITVAHRAIDARCRGEQREDLVSAGMVGLVQAAHSWRADGGAPFRFYAARRVRGAILDELRGRDTISRAERQRLRAGGDVFVPTLVSLDALSELGDRPTPIHAGPSSRPALVSAVAALPARERRVVAMTFARGMTLREVAAVVGLSESGVCRVRKRAIERLRSAIGAELAAVTP